MMFILGRFLSWHDFLSFKQKQEYYSKRISKFYDLYNAKIEMAETCLGIDQRIQAGRTHYGTKNFVKTVRQLQF